MDSAERRDQLILLTREDLVDRSSLARSYILGKCNRTAEEVAQVLLFHDHLYNKTDYLVRSREHVHNRTLELAEYIDFSTAFRTAKSELATLKGEYLDSFRLASEGL